MLLRLISIADFLCILNENAFSFLRELMLESQEIRELNILNKNNAVENYFHGIELFHEKSFSNLLDSWGQIAD